MKSRSIAILLLFISPVLFAEDDRSFELENDLGLGFIAGYKVGNHNTDMMSVQLAEGYTRDNRGCKGEIYISADDMSPLRFQIMAETIIAAYLNQKKVKFHSHLESGCNATFIGVEFY